MNKRILISIIAIAVLAGGVGFAMWQSSTTKQTAPDHEQTEDTINYDPPSEEEEQVGNEIKEELQNEPDEEQENSTDSQLNKVTIVISDASQYDNVVEVRSFIHNHIQEGICTFAFRKGNHLVKKEMPAFPDASTTICNNPNIARSEFPVTGDWELIVSYSSTDATGQSSAQTVRIR